MGYMSNVTMMDAELGTNKTVNHIGQFKLYWPMMIFLFLLAGSLIIISFHPATRPAVLEWTDEFFPERKLLAKTEATFLPDQSPWQVVKLQIRREVHLEIFRGENRKVVRLNLGQGKDVFVNFRGQATNLVVTDINGDGLADVIAPVLDENLVPRLQVFLYDKTLDDFVRSDAHSL